MNVLPEFDRSEACPSDFTFDLAVGGDATKEQLETLDAHVASCAECKDRYARFRAERTASARIPRRKRRPPYLLPALFTFAAAAAALLVVMSGDDRDNRQAKGNEVDASYFVKRGETVMRAADVNALEPGDVLRFTYSARDATHLAIVSVDGAGVVSLYFPETPVAVRLPPATQEPLPLATELDDTLGRETLFAFFCDEPMPPSSLVQRVERGTRSAPEGCTLRTLEFEKRSAP